MRTPRLGLVVLAAVLTACSGGGDDLDPEAEEDLLEDVILTLDDLPDGFVEADPDDDDDDDDGDEAFDECAEEVGIEPGAVDDVEVATAGPVKFETEDDRETFGSLEIDLSSVSDDGPPRAAFEALEDDDFVDCLEDAIAEQAEDDGQGLENIELQAIEVDIDGDATGGFRFSAELQGFEVVSEVQAVLVGDHLISIEFVSVNGGLDDDVVEAAFETMLERFEDAEN